MHFSISMKKEKTQNEMYFCVVPGFMNFYLQKNVHTIFCEALDRVKQQSVESNTFIFS